MERAGASALACALCALAFSLGVLLAPRLSLDAPAAARSGASEGEGDQCEPEPVPGCSSSSSMTRSIAGSAAALLEEEQLSRGAQFLGADGQAALARALVVVVGVGGVGSHCAHMLARSGVRRLRVIDFDNVSLSSLNRHALAGREDVGTPKVVALARHIARFAPFCDVDCRNEMFTAERAAALLEGAPDYVVDCIDDRNTKVALLAFCCLNKLRLMSSMGAGAKSDPTRVQIAEFRDVVKDPLASRMRWNLKQYLKDASNDEVDFESIEVVYSSELATVKLLPLDAEVAGEDPAELGAVPNFRVRVMPVLGTMPATFGLAMAARVVTNLAGKPFSPAPFQMMKKDTASKYRQRTVNRIGRLAEVRRKAAKAAVTAAAAAAQQGAPLPPLAAACEPPLVEWDAESVTEEDVAMLFQQFSQRCPITGARMGQGPNFDLVVWRQDRPVATNNLVVAAGRGLERVEEIAAARRLPTHVELGIPQGQFRRIVHTLDLLRSPIDEAREEAGANEWRVAAQRAVKRVNAERSEECLALVRALGERPDAEAAELLAVDRFEMLFRCTLKDGASEHAHVLFPSRVVEGKELSELIDKLAHQARTLLSSKGSDRLTD